MPGDICGASEIPQVGSMTPELSSAGDALMGQSHTLSSSEVPGNKYTNSVTTELETPQEMAEN